MTPSSAMSGAVGEQADSRSQEILASQIRLLYDNANEAVYVNIVAATLLGYLTWGVVPNHVVIAWWSYMLLVSTARYALAHQFRRHSRRHVEIGKWQAAFTTGTALAGAGWGGAGIFLYSEAAVLNQVFLLFVLGGMMLGAASVLAARPEAYLAFLIPTGLLPAARLILHGDQLHIAMGLLAGVFTLATLVTTGRIYRTIESTLRLHFENRDLVSDLQAAKSQTKRRLPHRRYRRQAN